jgi:hypothetical protein
LQQLFLTVFKKYNNKFYLFDLCSRIKPEFNREVYMTIEKEFICVMARINELEELIEIENDMRHEVRELKQCAQQLLIDSIRAVNNMVSTAKHISSTHKECIQKLKKEQL